MTYPVSLLFLACNINVKKSMGLTLKYIKMLSVVESGIFDLVRKATKTEEMKKYQKSDLNVVY